MTNNTEIGQRERTLIAASLLSEFIKIYKDKLPYRNSLREIAKLAVEMTDNLIEELNKPKQ